MKPQRSICAAALVLTSLLSAAPTVQADWEVTGWLDAWSGGPSSQDLTLPQCCGGFARITVDATLSDINTRPASRLYLYALCLSIDGGAYEEIRRYPEGGTSLRVGATCWRNVEDALLQGYGALGHETDEFDPPRP